MARHFLGTGVLFGSLNQLVVTADGSTLAVTVATGDAFVEGFFYRNDAALSLDIATANALNSRIDTVVVRLDRVANTVRLAVVTGTAAASPTPPALSQTDALFELPLANVTVPAAAGVIVAGNVTDRRVLITNRNAVGRRFLDQLIGANESTTSTGYVNLPTFGPSVTVPPPPSGRLALHYSASMLASSTSTIYAAPRIVRVSDGAVLSAPVNETSAQGAPTATFTRISGQRFFNGTPGEMVRVELQYRVDAGTGNFERRVLAVYPSP